jgi:flagellar assembly protein FliH
MPSFEKVRSAAPDERSPAQRAEEIEREAYEKGFEEGEKAGFAMGEQKSRVILEKLEKVVKELALFREGLVGNLEPQIVQLAVAIAKRILLREVSLSPETIVEITKEALTRLERTGQITIKIHPSLFDLFMKHRPSLLTVHPDIVFDVDPSVSAHGTVVVGTSEEVVTALDEQLSNLAKGMVA